LAQYRASRLKYLIARLRVCVEARHADGLAERSCCTKEPRGLLVLTARADC
jgi:hypothetical protein